MYTYPESDAPQRSAVHDLLPYKYQNTVRELTGLGFEFIGDDGFRFSGTVASVAFMPNVFLQVVSTVTDHVEWRYDRSAHAWGKATGYKHRFGGHEGHFILDRHPFTRA
ncbi:MAG: hypothetical protein JWO84_42 [Parcubacteria group bacterium]|nr:hypothetical protein [Parcubacteria group bacterium]